jgi:phosphocarrier protein FPr/phosphocarrier protein
MADLLLRAPFAAWAAPLDEAPDEVFAGRMLGDGVALDPLEGEVRAPCHGVVVAVAPTGHSVTLRHALGAEVLIHVGVDTVALGGAGFEPLAAVGAVVRAGDPLLRFDLDAVARRAASLVTPMIVLTPGFAVSPLAIGRTVAAGEPVCALMTPTATPAHACIATDGSATASRRLTAPLAHGLHARPAARLGIALQPFAAEVTVLANGRRANARSVTSLLALGVSRGDELALEACGADAEAAVAALTDLILGGLGEPAAPSRATPTRPAPPARAGEIIAVRAAPGGGVGTAVQFHAADRPVPETASAAAAERAALEAARARLRKALTVAARRDDIAGAHLAILDDPEIAAAAWARIAAGASAAFAWRAATRAMVDRIRVTGEARLIERTSDLIDVERQLIDALLGEADLEPFDLPPQAILLADELLPSSFLALDADRLAGVVTAAGGPTSHVAILAASRGVPMLVSAGPEVLAIADGTLLILDDEAPALRVAPSAAALANHAAKAAAAAALARTEACDADGACITADGTRIEVFANCGSQEDAVAAIACGAEGCGLLRTEFLFLERQAAPSEDEQAAVYREVAAALGARPLILRTLDAGSDKPLAYLPTLAEDNPALGLRGLRLSLAHPDLLAEQFRAILRGTPASQRRIMLPMVNDLTELRAARTLLKEAETEMGVDAATPLGVMVETPAAALLAGQLAREADFLSVGTNDLAQYTLAMDRGHAQLAERNDALHPAVLRLIALAAKGAKSHGRWIGVCGAIASDRNAAALLIGLGVDELSASPRAIPALKARIRRLDMDACRALAAAALEERDAAGVRRLIAAMRLGEPR